MTPGFMDLARAVVPPIALRAVAKAKRTLFPAASAWRAVESWPRSDVGIWGAYWASQGIENVSAEDAAYRSGGALNIPLDAPTRINFLAFASLVSRHAVDSRATRLSIIDFGGGFGVFSRIAQWAAPGVSIEYHVVDVPAVAEMGQALRPDISFHGDLSDAPDQADIVMASGALQCCEDWRSVLSNLAGRARRSLYLSRLPMVQDIPSFVLVQRMPHGGTSHGWAWNAGELQAEIKKLGLSRAADFALGDLPPVAGARGLVQSRAWVVEKPQILANYTR